MDSLFSVGQICKSKDAIIRCASADEGKLCRVVSVVASERWRRPNMPEYKVELLSLPVSAFRSAADLDPIR